MLAYIRIMVKTGQTGRFMRFEIENIGVSVHFFHITPTGLNTNIHIAT